ncbi:MAG: type II secretion system F family protein [Deltaproteobacteria bacterium]|nr:MAG: type II secretion system F family protein [Deltaproteobacteria bacterium]
MPEFIWKGVNRKGKKKKGEMEAESENFVRLTLRRQGIEVSSIKPKPKDIFANIKFLQPKVTEKDIVVMTRQFATMIDAGLPLVQCLEILFSQEDNRTFKRILKQIKEDVEEGSTFADALKKHPDVFDELFVNLVAAGEIGGILDIILNRLAAYIEKAAKLKKKVKGAMTYPIVVMVIAVLVVAVILIFVIPVFQQMFADFGRALPVPTQIVVNLSNFTKNYILYIIVALGVIVFAFRRFYRTEKGRALVDNLVLKAPVFGMLIRKVAVAKFTRTLGTMISSGVPILDSLEIVAATAGNKTIEAALRETRQSISEGRTISEPLLDSEVFPSMVVQMISVGEATGALDTMLGKIADFYDDEVDAAVEALTSMLEPFMMVFLGGTIGGLVISMYLPIFQMAGAVSG